MESVCASHKESEAMQQRLFGVGIFGQPLTAALAVATLTSAAAAGTYVPGTSEVTIEAIEAQLDHIQNPRGTQRFNPGNRWSGTAGEPRIFSYSFAKDGTAIGTEFDGAPSASILFSVMDAQFGDTQQWQDALTEAFRQWDVVSGIEFVFVSDPAETNGADDGAAFSTGNAGSGERGDIRIGMKSFVGGAGGLCAVGLREFGGSDYGEIVLDASEDWTVTNGANLTFLTNCVAREIGIAVGLAVACPLDNSKLMEPSLPPSTGFFGPQLDDVRAVNRLYGDDSVTDTGGTPDENGAIATARPLDEEELLLQIFLASLSLDKATETDYYAFTIPEDGAEVTFSVNPQPSVNGSYEDGPFVGGVCQPGGTTNATEIQDLRLEILDSAGLTIPGGELMDANGLGGGESIVGLGIPTAGTYYLVVSSDATVDEVQLYTFIAQMRVGVAPGERIVHMDEILPLLNYQAIDNRGDITATGENVVIASIEGGLPWLDHAALIGSNTQNVFWQGTDPTPLIFTDHATGVVGTAIGQPDTDPDNMFTGIAPNSNVVAATIASAIDPLAGFAVSDRAFLFSLYGLTDHNFMTSLGFPRGASILNLSWGAPGDVRGETEFPRAIDAVVAKTGVLAVIAAGNLGTIDDGNFCGDGDEEIPGGQFIGARTVTAPASSYNGLSVGAVGAKWRGQSTGAGDDNEGINSSEKVASFSSRGPIDSFNFAAGDLENNFNTRPGIHIVAQGTGLVLPSTTGDPRTDDACPYFGDWIRSQSLNLPWIDPDDIDLTNLSIIPGADQEFFAVGLAEPATGIPGPPPDPGGVQGTSFAAPIVAGVSALLQDEALRRDKSINSLVLRSILMTSAKKLPGWSNNGLSAEFQLTRDGQILEFDQVFGQQIAQDETDQPLDYVQGAGLINILNAIQVYFGQLNLDRFPIADHPAIMADPQPEHFFSHLHDSPLTNPTVPTITRVDTFVIPDPFPGSPGDVTPANPVSDATTSDDQGPRTPLQIAKALHESRKTLKVDTRMRHWADVDPDIGIPDPGGPGSGIDIGDAPFDGNPFIPPDLTGPPPGDGDYFVRATIIDDPIEGGRIGWDIANLGLKIWPGRPAQGGGRHGYLDYRIGPFNIDGENGIEAITATLVWDRNVRTRRVNWQSSNFNPEPELLSLELENLDLELYSELGVNAAPVFVSNSTLNNIEHIHFPLPVTGTGVYYILRVRWIEQEYDLFNNNPLASVKFALSWKSQSFDNIADFESSLYNSSAEQGTAPVIPPVSIATVSSLISNLGATDADANYDSNLDMDNNGVLNVTDIAKMIFQMQNGG